MKLVLSLLVGLAGAAASATAAPILYNINFITTGGTSGASSITPTAGQFTYDSDSGEFSSFIVQWNGISFDLTVFANAPNILNGCDPASQGVANGFVTFAVFFQTGPPSCFGSLVWRALTLRSGSDATFEFLTETLFPNPAFADIIGVVHNAPFTTFISAGGTYTAVAAVPEPGTVSLILCGGLLLAAHRRRRTSSKMIASVQQ